MCRIAQYAGIVSLCLFSGCSTTVIPSNGSSTTVSPVTAPVTAAPSSPVAPVAPVVIPTTYSAALNSTSDFIGASIIQYWPMPMHNNGIAGQTSAQVLARFASDVLNHGYQRVIILCGTNDILQSDPNLTTELPANLKAMADMATSAGIEVVLSKLPPLTANGLDLNPTVVSADNAIAQMASQNGYLIVDYYTPLFGHPEYFIDGIHPNPAGYAVMEQALSAVVLH
jgi:GDSL-like Lipase/Acylhydrolase family